MYHEITIQTPSPSQRRKLIKGQPVRVKVGEGVNIFVSPQQHKKMMKAHRLGKAHTLTMDPYQAEQHGSGILGGGKRGGKLPSLKSLGKTISKGLKQVGRELQPVAKQVVKAVEPVAKSVGKELLKLGKEHGREALHLAVNEGVGPAMMALSTYTGQPELMAATPLVKKVANSAVDDLGDRYGFGVGGKRGRRPKSYGIMEGRALYPA